MIIMVLKTLAKLSPVESVRGEEGRRNERERANQKVYGLRARKKKNRQGCGKRTFRGKWMHLDYLTRRNS